ncbi:hypothetical protein [Castellaniella sp. S9]|nr:hypothetical protein [Castellaniella sp. S9]
MKPTDPQPGRKPRESRLSLLQGLAILAVLGIVASLLLSRCTA